MELDKMDTALLGAGTGVLGSSLALTGDASNNIEQVVTSIKELIDGGTNLINDGGTTSVLEALGIETMGALGTGGLSVLLTFLMSSKDKKFNAIIRSLIISGVITTSGPLLMAALTGFVGKKIWDIPWQGTGPKAA